MFQRISLATVLLFVDALVTCASGQVRPRISRPVDESALVRLPRSTHRLANAANVAGRAAPGLRMDGILLQLKTSPEQQAALDRLLAEQQDPASPRYHQWLTPEEYGLRFGAAQQDLDAITAWLQSHGFQIANIAKGRTTIEFSGTARQVENAFHTEMRRYVVQGRSHVANAADIAIPDALSAVVEGVVSLHSFPRRSLHHFLNLPENNLRSGGHAMVPYDFAAIYNVAPLWNNGFDGTGQTIAIPGRTDIKLSDVTLFRTTYGLPGNNTQVIVNGRDPGVVSRDEETEADLDVEWSGAVAPGATVKFVVSGSTASSDGVDLSSLYIVNNNIASVMSVSFGDCEQDLGSSGNLFYSGLWSQAAAQGISVFVASGDNGSAGCDVPESDSSSGSNITRPASGGLTVSGLASTPNNVAVGGTEFNDTASPSTWWNSANDAHAASAKGYIPEAVWNESSYSTFGASTNGLWAGSGGVSSIYATPVWQRGNGVPSTDPGSAGAHHRYIPDISLNGAGHDGYLIYVEGTLGVVGGTSASSPSMAGVMALINQYTGARNGNPNPTLYALAAKAPAIYHDVTSGTNAVPCTGGSPNCGAATGTGVLTGFAAGPGYDLATGWGSLDGYALALNWSSNGTPAPAIGALTPNPMTASAAAQILTISGSSFQVGATVKVGATVFSGAQVTFVSSSQLNISVTEPSAGSLPVQVTNPNTLASNTATLQVNAPAAPPVITTVAPNPMVGSNAAQTLTVTGTGFVSGLSLQIGSTSFSGSQLLSVSATQVQVSVNVGTATRSIAVQVVNPGGQSSNTAILQVNGPGTPSIASVGPATLTHSTANQIVTLNGSGFQPVQVRVLLTYPGGSEQAGIISAGATQIVALINVGNTPRTWSVQVLNADGGASNLVNLAVQ